MRTHHQSTTTTTIGKEQRGNGKREIKKTKERLMPFFCLRCAGYVGARSPRNAECCHLRWKCRPLGRISRDEGAALLGGEKRYTFRSQHLATKCWKRLCQVAMGDDLACQSRMGMRQRQFRPNRGGCGLAFGPCWPAGEQSPRVAISGTFSRNIPQNKKILTFPPPFALCCGRVDSRQYVVTPVQQCAVRLCSWVLGPSIPRHMSSKPLSAASTMCKAPR